MIYVGDAKFSYSKLGAAKMGFKGRVQGFKLAGLKLEVSLMMTRRFADHVVAEPSLKL